MSLAQSVSAVASTCDPGHAGGQITNNASTSVVVQMKVTWVSVSGATLASGEVASTKVPANGTSSWASKPNHSATGVLSCTASITEVKRG